MALFATYFLLIAFFYGDCIMSCTCILCPTSSDTRREATQYAPRVCTLVLFILFKVMKSPRDASMKVEGDRHQNGLKIDSTDVQVYVHCIICIIGCVKP